MNGYGTWCPKRLFGTGRTHGYEGEHRMRILWFVNMPLPAVTQRCGQPPIHHGSWLAQLEVALRDIPDLHLGIAATAHSRFAHFESQGVVYYGIGPGDPASGVTRVVERWRSLTHPNEDLNALRSVIAAFRPDLIHVHGTEQQFGLLAGQIATPVVVSIQGILSVCELMDSRGVDASLLLSLSPRLFVRGTGMLLGHAVLRRGAARERRIIRNCHHVIGRTRFDADVVRVINPRATYYHCDEPLRDEFRAAIWEHDRSGPHAVFSVTGGYARKGLGTLLRAIAALREGPVPQIRLRLAGLTSGGSEDVRAVAREIRRLHLEAAVTNLGSLGPDGLVRELLRARVFALPTHADNSPNSLAEAMIVGTPCVASAAGGIPSLARDGLEALLVQDGDPYSLAGAIVRLLEDTELARRLSRNARTAAMNRHDPAKVRDTLIGIYRVILAGAGFEGPPKGR